MSKELKIQQDYLEELLKHVGSSCVGKVCKRFELFDDKELIKKSVKEVIYEEMRHFRDLLIAHNVGLDMQQFKFSREPKQT